MSVLEFRGLRRRGHAGTTVQPVDETIRSSRLGAELGSVLATAAARDSHDIASQVFPALQAPEQTATVVTTLQIQRTSEILDARRWPVTYQGTFDYDLGATFK